VSSFPVTSYIPVISLKHYLKTLSNIA